MPYLLGQILHQFSLLEKDIALRLKLPDAAAKPAGDAAAPDAARANGGGGGAGGGAGGGGGGLGAPMGAERRTPPEGAREGGSFGRHDQRGMATRGGAGGGRPSSAPQPSRAEQRNPAASCARQPPAEGWERRAEEVPLFHRGVERGGERGGERPGGSSGGSSGGASSGAAKEGIAEEATARRLHETREMVLRAASGGYDNPVFRAAVRQLHQEALAASIQHDVALQTAFLLMRAAERAKGAEVAVVVARMREDAQASRLVPAKDGRRGGGSSSASDCEVALRRGGEDDDVRLRFKTRSEAVLSRIREALAEQNYRTIHREAHSLKSIALYMGADRVTKAADELQEAAP